MDYLQEAKKSDVHVASTPIIWTLLDIFLGLDVQLATNLFLFMIFPLSFAWRVAMKQAYLIPQ